MVSGKDLKDVKVKEVRWYWKPFIPQGQVTLVQGDTNVGKTNILTYILWLCLAKVFIHNRCIMAGRKQSDRSSLWMMG